MYDLNSMKIVRRRGYEAVYLPNHIRAYDDGMVYLHILVAENILGRCLTPNEVVHHIDENKNNNIASNLMVFASNHDHVLYHNCIRYNLDYSLICVNHIFKCICLSETKHNSKCPICGKIKTISAKYCQDCYNDIRMMKKPDRYVLKQQLKLKNFVKISKNFQVTDNAVRKWCKSYNLPYKTQELKQLTNEQIDNL